MNLLKIRCGSYFPGQSDTKDDLGRNDRTTIAKILKGERSPQIKFVDEYFTKIKSYLTNCDSTPVIQIFGHSIGSVNALYAKHLLQKHTGDLIPTVLFEPLGAAQEASFILQAEKNSAAAEHLKSGVSTIRSNPPTEVASLQTGTSFGNKAFGEAFYFINSSDADPYILGGACGTFVGGTAAGTAAGWLDRFESRRTATVKLAWLTLLLITASAPGTGTYLGNEIDRGMVNHDFHDLAANFRIVYKNRSALKRAVDEELILASNEEILQPENYRSNFFERVRSSAASRLALNIPNQSAIS